MSSYIQFNEREICLNCPRNRCVFERGNVAVCYIIKARREELRHKQEEKRRIACKNLYSSET